MDISVINDDYQVSVTNNGIIVSIPVTNNSNDASIINAYVATYDQENVLSKISMGTASIDNANSDYLEGNNVVFKAKVEPAKVYEVTITYQGVLDSEYVNSDLVGARKTIHNDDTGLAEKTYIIPVVDDVLDLTISSTWTTKEDLDGDSKAETTVTHTTSPRIASISIVKRPDKTANAIPNIYHVGDSTSANNGSWAYRLSNSEKTYPELFSLCKFYNRGAGGRNLCS